MLLETFVNIIEDKDPNIRKMAKNVTMEIYNSIEQDKLKQKINELAPIKRESLKRRIKKLKPNNFQFSDLKATISDFK